MKAKLQAVLDREPELTPYGFDPYKSKSSLYAVKGESIDEYRERIAKARTKFELGGFAVAYEFCLKVAPIQSINTGHSSYGLKHAAERWFKTYVAKGEFIAAAIAAGFHAKRYGDGPNATFNMSEKSLRSLGAGQ